MYCERDETRQTKVSEQNTSNRKLVFLRNGSSGLIRQKWRAGTSKRRIGLRENTLRFEVIDKSVLGVVEVKFELLTKKTQFRKCELVLQSSNTYLVNCWDYFSCWEDLLELLL